MKLIYQHLLQQKIYQTIFTKTKIRISYSQVTMYAITHADETRTFPGLAKGRGQNRLLRRVDDLMAYPKRGLSFYINVRNIFLLNVPYTQRTSAIILAQITLFAAVRNSSTKVFPAYQRIFFNQVIRRLPGPFFPSILP